MSHSTEQKKWSATGCFIIGIETTWIISVSYRGKNPLDTTSVIIVNQRMAFFGFEMDLFRFSISVWVRTRVEDDYEYSNK